VRKIAWLDGPACATALAAILRTLSAVLRAIAHPTSASGERLSVPMNAPENMRLRIAFQGEPGANSQIACREAYPAADAVPYPTFEDALNAATSGEADLAMIPIENSLAGRVADIHHLMPDAGLHIVAEWFLPIRNQLLALKGTQLGEIKSIESHVMALGQCRNFIRKLGVKTVVAADTAGAAREVAERGKKSCAAIASTLAAEIYGLDILAANIEDAQHSTTRFIVLSRAPERAARGTEPILTTFVFQVRNIPAALYKALGGFATNGVNMTKLESYMLEGTFSATQFYADVEGHPEEAGLKLALEELAFFSEPGTLKLLGVYSAHRFRATLAKNGPARLAK
jgi:prephenate dehydratase